MQMLVNIPALRMGVVNATEPWSNKVGENSLEHCDMHNASPARPSAGIYTTMQSTNKMNLVILKYLKLFFSSYTKYSEILQNRFNVGK